MSAVLTAQEPSAKYLVNLQPPLVRHFDLIAKAPGGVARRISSSYSDTTRRISGAHRAS